MPSLSILLVSSRTDDTAHPRPRWSPNGGLRPATVHTSQGKQTQHKNRNIKKNGSMK